MISSEVRVQILPPTIPVVVGVAPFPGAFVFDTRLSKSVDLLLYGVPFFFFLFILNVAMAYVPGAPFLSAIRPFALLRIIISPATVQGFSIDVRISP